MLDTAIVVIVIIIASLLLLLLWFVPKKQAKKVLLEQQPLIANPSKEVTSPMEEVDLPEKVVASTKSTTSSSTDINEKRFGIENEARKTLAQILGGLLVLLGAAVTLHTAFLTQRETQENRKLTLEGQVTDRFTKAITQLGDQKLEVRLGGIYALERIAKDSQRDNESITDVLTAYVRERSPAKDKKPEETSLPSVDIQAVITVLSRRPWGYLRGENYRINLSNANLQGIQFGKDTERAIFANQEAKFQEMTDRMMDFNAIDLNGSDLRGATFNFAQLSGATFNDANLSGARFYKANLVSATIRNANCSKASFYEADLRGVQFEGTDFSHADLNRALLDQAQLDGANLSGTLLQQTDLRKVSGFYFEIIQGPLISNDTQLPPQFDARKRERLEQQRQESVPKGSPP